MARRQWHRNRLSGKKSYMYHSRPHETAHAVLLRIGVYWCRNLWHVSETFVQLTGNGSDNRKQNGGIGVVVDNKNPSTFEAQDDWVCTVCKIIFNDETDKILECEVCCSRKCAKCLKLTNAQYVTTQRVDLIWLCSKKCREHVNRMLKKPPESGHSTASAAEPAVDIAAIVTDAASKIVNVVAETLSDSLHPSESEPATSDDNQAWEKVIHKRAKQTKDLVKAAIVEHAKQKTQDEARERNVIHNSSTPWEHQWWPRNT